MVEKLRVGDERGLLIRANQVEDPNEDHYTYFIVDVLWWTMQEPAISNWMDENLPRGSAQRQGVVIEFDSLAEASLFMLRWS